MPGVAPGPGLVNQTLPAGTSVTTAGGGRATLDNGEQHIVVGPNSRLTVQADAGGFTRIAQDLGNAMFKVDKKAAPHFRVDTPLLAAIVKGTTFTVVVESASDAVNVAEGLVEVRANQNGMTADVATGATGTVMRDAPQTVSVMTPAMAPAGPAVQPTSITPIDYKAASGGLIDAVSAADVGVPPAVARSNDTAPSNNAVGATAQDTTATSGGSAAAVVSQIASLEARQTAVPIQAMPTSSVAGNGNNGAASGPGNNGNSSNGSNAAAGGAITTVNNTTDGLTGSLGPVGGASGDGNSNSGNGNNGNGNGNANANNGGGNGNGNSGNANGASGNGNGNNGNGNGGSNTVVGGVLTTVGNTTTGAIGGVSDTLGSVLSGNGNSGNGNANGNNGNANGVSGNGNGNGNNGNGNGNGGSNNTSAVVPTVVATVSDTAGGLLGALTGNGNSGNGNSGNGNSGNGK